MWHNTLAVIHWFKSIPNKTKAQFKKFDFVEFYPSITAKLLDNAVSILWTNNNNNSREYYYLLNKLENTFSLPRETFG